MQIKSGDPISSCMYICIFKVLKKKKEDTVCFDRASEKQTLNRKYVRDTKVTNGRRYF